MTDSPLVTLKASAKEFNFDKLKAGENNQLANSGRTMYNDINRIDFVINEKEIDSNLISAFKNGAKEYEFDKLWQDHCKIAGNQKTNSYKEEFEGFYNAGREHTNLLVNEKTDYRAFAKEVFKKMFAYAEAQIPNDAILEELITNCNQAGYEFVYAPFITKLCATNELLMVINSNEVDRKVHINCTDPNSIEVECRASEFPVNEIKQGSKVCDMSFSVKFTVELQNNSLTYNNGELSLTIPKELKNHKDGGKSLFDFIKECFQKFCEKLGFKFEEKVTHRFDETYLKEVKPPVNVVILTPRPLEGL